MSTVAEEMAAAMEEARVAFNGAKKAGVEVTTVKRRTLFLLLSTCCVAMGIPFHDVSTGTQIYDPSPLDPDAN